MSLPQTECGMAAVEAGISFRMAKVAVVCFAILGLAAVNATTVAAQSAVPVIVSEAMQQELFDRVEALGTLRANEQVTVTAQVTETVTALHFDDGQRVKKGDILAEMTSAEESAQFTEAEATVQEAKEQLDRTAKLAKRGVSAQAILSERRRIYETAVAQLAAVKSRLTDRRISAPFNGLIGLRRVSVGALVQPGTVVTTIDDDSVMKLDFTVPATFLETLKIGLPVEAKARAFANRKFKGQITAIDSRVDPVTRSITVRALIPNQDRVLKAGILMTVEILKNRRQTIVVPEEAIIARGRDASVFVVDPVSDTPTAERRAVEIGSREKGIVEITSGLRRGEFVIVDGTLRVSPGSSVEITAVDSGNDSLADLIRQKSSQHSNIN